MQAARGPQDTAWEAARSSAPIHRVVDGEARLPTSLADRVMARLRSGSSTHAIAAAEGISPALAQIMVEDLQRRGLAMGAESLCASGLGACGEGPVSEQAALHCAGCPLVSLRRRSA